MALTDRQRVLGALFLGVSVVTLAILSRVLETVFFAITVAYVLYPVRRLLVRRGVPRRIAAAAATTVGFVFVVLLVTPIGFALYIRREELLAFIQNVPSELQFTAFGMTETVDVSRLLVEARDAVVSIGVGIASAAPVIALKLFLFVLLVYGLLLRPSSVRRATTRVVPGEYHDVVLALHERVRDTLYALYVLQAATALGTFAVAYVVFWALQYDAAFSLAIFAGILQFIPVIGPSLLIVLVAAGQVIAGDVVAAILVTVIGLILIGFLPDAIIRPRLASVTTGMPASLYFVGFTGGTLTLGVVGVIAGPLVVALLAEVVELLTDERTSVQQTLGETTPREPTDADTRDSRPTGSGGGPASQDGGSTGDGTDDAGESAGTDEDDEVDENAEVDVDDDSDGSDGSDGSHGSDGSDGSDESDGSDDTGTSGG